MKTITVLFALALSCVCALGQGIGGYGVPGVGGIAATNVANVFTALQMAKGFAPVIAQSSGPFSVYFNDFYSAADNVANSVGSPTGNSCVLSNAGIDANHPGNLLLTSGTGGTGTGADCGLQSVSAVINNLQSTTLWGIETEVKVPVLPGTTVGAYQFGMPGSPNANPWTTAIGFNLSSANGVANDWYCRYGSTQTDTTVAASTGWTNRLAMVNDGTNVHWYVNGTQVCGTGVAVTSMPNTGAYPDTWASVAMSGSSVQMYVDYVAFVRQVTR